MTSVVTFRDVGFTYAGAPAPTLRGVDLDVAEGELLLVVGPTGSGKSTLLQAVPGLVPRFTGGLLTGEVRVAGRSTADVAPRDLADVVGTVGQDPAAGFVADTVEDELAYVMENLAVPPEVMRRRMEDTLDLLGLAGLRNRPLATLSGGQQQRVAIGAVLAANPRILVLDEPTSALDPAAADEVLAALTRLVHDQGLTVIVAEHRLERIVQFADRVVLVPGGGPVVTGSPRDVLGDARAPRPPVVRLAEVAGWSPLPLTVREARRHAGELRERLGQDRSGALEDTQDPVDGGASVAGERGVASMRGVRVHHGPVLALAGVDLTLDPGEVVALMGRNGAGKSTLLSVLAGMRRPGSGSVLVDGRPPTERPPRELVRHVGLVPQDVGILLVADTVGTECVTADRDAGLPVGTTAAALERLVPGIDPGTHPRDLSEGQRLALGLAVVLAPGARLICLDEPTRGLDEGAKARLVAVLRELAAVGRTVLLATHDVELVAELADRVVLLADGEVVADGPTRSVVCASPVFAPQVARVLAPAPWLTVAEVRRAVEPAP
jgi:energy-coupling factor transport system ATP-binding protein